MGASTQDYSGLIGNRKVSVLLAVGIFFCPIIFVWWLSKPGYSARAKQIGFSWLAVWILIAVVRQAPNTSQELAPDQTTKPSAVSDTAQAPAPPISAAPVKPASNWSYSEDVDKMRGTKTRFASIESKNELTFGFPYKGGTATLTLRQRPSDGLNVLLQIEGQFICRSYNDDTVAVKFDNGPIEHYGCGEPAAGTTGVLFIEGELASEF